MYVGVRVCVRAHVRVCEWVPARDGVCMCVRVRVCVHVCARVWVCFTHQPELVRVCLSEYAMCPSCQISDTDDTWFLAKSPESTFRVNVVNWGQ